MPSRASISLLLKQLHMKQSTAKRSVNALTGQYLIVTEKPDGVEKAKRICVNALTGQYLIVTQRHGTEKKGIRTVSMPSRASISLLRGSTLQNLLISYFRRCQCPHGLVSHCYKNKPPYSMRRSQVQCQCPHGLVSHCYKNVEPDFIASIICVNALTGQYLIVTWISRPYWEILGECVNALTGQYLIVTVPLQKPRFYAVSRACFCRYLSEYSDSSCFSCMLTFWTYLMRYTYP